MANAPAIVSVAATRSANTIGVYFIRTTVSLGPHVPCGSNELDPNFAVEPAWVQNDY
ncbi:MAG: hypothetical protein IH867_10420 [Chloroflexi bacterium]|nr:hypothetical protein [Chloroflexota bacterium]